MRLIYLGGPYSHKEKSIMNERVEHHAKVLAYFARTAENLVLYSPIIHWSMVAYSHDLPHDFNYWKQQDFHMIRTATAMWVTVLPGWRESFGLGQELEYAKDIGREIMYVIQDSTEFHITSDEPS